ncbi:MULTISPECIES: response regulator transcription factor [unclassified Streptomyces]|uniref:helix-turn-helix transcriptional regulator n=1 Tax=unclassified Streptomyces TaxID=2593676 RepID=UPI003D93DF8A
MRLDICRLGAGLAGAGGQVTAELAAQAVSGALRTLTAQDDSQKIIGAVRAHVDGLLHRDPRALASAVTGYRSTGRPLALAAACEDLGELKAASADTTPAIPYFEEAGRLASAAGAGRDHERIRRRLRQLGVRTGAPRHQTTGPPEWGNLTESERKLIPLVVDGLTNRAIADRLYVSVHTVNTHMKHIFTKLGINSRVELTRLAIERGH